MAASGLLLLIFVCRISAAETTTRSGLRATSSDSYATHLRNLQTLVAACSAKASACDAGQIGPDESISLGNAGSFDVHYDWFSRALDSAKALPDADRAKLMRSASAHLDSDLADANKAASPAAFDLARNQADAILAQREFQTSREVSLSQKLLTAVYEWVDRLLSHVSAFGARSPLLGPLIEWGLISAALALFLAWEFRNISRQRQRLLIEADRQIEQADERVLNWLREAEDRAAHGEFRDAIHCLYWASIAMLEGRRLWQPDRARTPREYLRLLDPDSSLAPILRRQTLSFETIWYGIRPALQPDYEQALDLHRQLRRP